jgi:hypothetical protein
MMRIGDELIFSNGFVVYRSHDGYELTCNGNFVSYSKELNPLLDFLVIQLKT